VPVLSMLGRERTPAGLAEDELLVEAESLASLAMRPDARDVDEAAAD
jgi:ATP-dependent Lhr-like helicase